MKSTILKTLAAASLVAAAQADVHVLGAVWKERGINAPDGEILLNPGTVAATRGYLIFDQNILTATPSAGTLILYRDIRSGGNPPVRQYTIDTSFSAFTADVILGDSGGRRMFGHIIAPVTIADVGDVTMTFTGSVFASELPNRLHFDNTVFQTGTATGLTGPRIVGLPEGSIQRSVISGSAVAVNVGAVTVATATAELQARLDDAGFVRGEVGPVITTDLEAAAALRDGEQKILSVGLDPDTFGTVSYRWFRNNVEVATTPTFTVTGGQAATGAGTYRVEVTNDAGTDVSSDIVVTARANTFTTDLLPAVAIIGGNSTTLSVVLNPVPVTAPTYQWFRNATAISAANGGTAPTLLVVGGEALTGAGTYRVEVTNSAGTLVSTNSVITVTTVGTNFAFTNNLPRTQAVGFSATATLNPVIAVGANPAVATRQWFKASLATPTVFAPIAAGDGGTAATYIVSGNNANVNGPGVYRMTATSTTGITITTIDSTVTTAP